MADVVYRVADPQERSAVADLWRQVENNAEFLLAEPSERATPMPDRSFEIVAGHDPLLGSVRVMVGRFRRVAHCGHLVLGVLPGHRGQGIGTGLLQTLIKEEAPARGLTRLQLNVAVENPAHRLYSDWASRSKAYVCCATWLSTPGPLDGVEWPLRRRAS